MLKKAEIDELEVALNWPENAAEFRLWFGEKVRYGSSADAIWQQIKADERGTFTFYHEEELIGFAQAYEKIEKGIHIACLIVSPKVRGKGLGRAFVKALMENAWTHKQADFITLNVYPENLPARALYKSLGFCEIGENQGMVAMRIEKE
ncbi:GNAT family N-acetyltransferase [Idiomarina sp. HP20-50]|uniref:GNAT family N-acetyltransferase n=1 Tax=Idiomarina sp. HP20-50 TaxID=3070813 RepID=UPI00294AC5A6|nr:GNAT family N-acetyltransferase [Idiomarina sp. HP20-50]MDV6316706.1 GNAT family N-acetyltransferase [Idiomarina sp. HP20-50]